MPLRMWAATSIATPTQPATTLGRSITRAIIPSETIAPRAGCLLPLRRHQKTFSYLGWYAWWRLILWIRRKHPQLTWKQVRRRYYGADRIREDDLLLYNPAKMRVERYRFRAAKSRPPTTSTSSIRTEHATAGPTTTMPAFVGQVSEHLT
jgi:hypothetical protein